MHEGGHYLSMDGTRTSRAQNEKYEHSHPGVTGGRARRRAPQGGSGTGRTVPISANVAKRRARGPQGGAGRTGRSVKHPHAKVAAIARGHSSKRVALTGAERNSQILAEMPSNIGGGPQAGDGWMGGVGGALEAGGGIAAATGVGAPAALGMEVVGGLFSLADSIFY